MSSPAYPLTIYPLDEIVALARAHSPYYHRAYAHLPAKPALSELPPVEPASYWEAHSRDAREILTGPLRDGIVLNTGGSTGAPKYSYYNDEEYDSAIALEARVLEATRLPPGARVANLFGSGYLYSSFFVLQESLKAMPTGVLQLPIGYFTPMPDTVRLIRAFRANVLAGVPTHLMSLLAHLQKEGVGDVSITHFLFAGEPFTADQRRQLEAVFPGVEVRSIGYASVDAGLMGNISDDCGPGEHRLVEDATVLEIVDEDTGEIIREAGRPGRILTTNLTRRLMPILRYPSGDLGQWVEPPGTPARKFLLMGRSEDSARLSTFNVAVAEIAALLEPFREALGIGPFQIVITQENQRDLLILRVVSERSGQELEAGSVQILEALARSKPVVAEMVARGVVNPVRIEWIGLDELERNPRTGKARRVIDRRVV